MAPRSEPREERRPREATPGQKLGLLLVSLVLAGAIAELVARGVQPLTDCPSFDYRVPDPVYGWRLEPGARYRCQLPEGTARVAYDAEGWRDREERPAPAPGARRAVILGDSFMEAYSVELEAAFTRQLSAEAARAGAPLETFNLGVGGYGTLQELLVFRDFGAARKPDLVLLGFYPENDLANNSAELERLGTRGGTLKTTIRPFLEPGPEWRIARGDFDEAWRRYQRQRAPLAHGFRRWRDRSLVVDAAVARWKAIRRLASPPDPDEEARRREGREMRRLGAYRCKEAPVVTRAWAQTGRILERLDAEVAAVGARLVVFTVPGMIEVDRGIQEEELGTALDPEALCLEEAPAYARLAALLGTLDIPLVDLLPAFRREAREHGRAVFRASDRHWGPEGHALAAREVTRALGEQGWLEADGL